MEKKEREEYEKEYEANLKIEECPICDNKIDRDDHDSCEGCGKVSISTNDEGQGTCIECASGFFNEAVESARRIMKKVVEDHTVSDELRKEINFYFQRFPERDEDGDFIYVEMDENGKWIKQ